MASEKTLGALMAVTAALMWAVVPIGLKYLVGVIEIQTIVWFRFAVSFLFLAAYYAIRSPGHFVIFRKLPLLGVLAGLSLAGNYFGHTTGVELTSPGNAQILVQMAPLLLAVVGVLHFKERLRRTQKIGFGLALIGFVLFNWDQLSNLVVARDVHLKGDLWLVFAAAAWATFAVSQKILVTRWTPQQSNLLIYATAALFFCPRPNSTT